MYFDKNGNAINVQQWVVFIEDKTYRVIKQEIVDKYLVSTIWTGIDIGYKIFKYPLPLIFETMIFSNDENPSCDFDLYQEKYATIEQALHGHKKACEFIL